MKGLLVYVTAASRKEGDRIAEALVREKLAACVSIVPDVLSRFWWKGKVEYATEYLLLIKTKPKLFKSVEKRVKSLHSYRVPEILAVPVAQMNLDYAAWLRRSVR